MGLGVFSLHTSSKHETKPEEAQAVGASAYWDSWASTNSSIINKGGKNFVSALKSKITQVADGNSNTVSYAQLWTIYKESDAVPGTENLAKPLIWDMYGGFAFTYGDDQAGSYKNEGDVYNREHSVPKSWFSEHTPAYSDLVHLVPTDGKVNGMRSNYTFGEVQSSSYSYSFNARSYNGVQYQNAGISKLGSPKTINGVSSGKSIVFEPDDQYKGDFARIYMYFAVRYGGGTCQATTGDGGAIFTSTLSDSNPYVTNYGLALLRKWHVQDKVSTKETNRNNYIEKYQGNRNPFVDHPEWADKIFGTEYGDPTPSVTISQETATIGIGENITLTASASNSSAISWSTSNSSVATVSNGVVIGKAAGSATITASATINNVVYSATCAVTVSSTPSLSSISIKTAPTKTTYQAGENFDPTGLVITRTYSNGTSSDYTYANHTSEFSFSPSLSTSLTTEHTHVTITYDEKSTSQSITVTASSGSGEAQSISETITFSEKGYSDGASVTTVNGTYGNVVFAQGSGNNPPKYYNSGTSVRAYAGNTITFSSSYTIKQIVITFGNGGDSNSITSNTGTYSNGTWTGSASSVVLSIGGTSGHRRISSVTIIYESSSLPVATSIIATVSKTYYVGETISVTDITVKNDLNQTVSSFTFEDDGYQFTYEDAASGGATTSCLFDDSISSGDFRCSLTVEVQRKERTSTNPQSYSISYSDLPTSYDTSSTIRTASSGIKYIAYNVAHYSNNPNKMQFKGDTNGGGYIQTTDSLNLSSVIVNSEGSNTLSVYGSLDGTTFSNSITKVNGSYNLSGYHFIKVIRVGSGAGLCESLTINVGASDTALNVANYIMFEDTNNQCSTKLNTAIGYLHNLTQTERNTFRDSNDFVIATARERLEAWATSKGKTIDYSDGSLVNANRVFTVNSHENNTIIVLVIISMVGISSIGACLYIRKKKSN